MKAPKRSELIFYAKKSPCKKSRNTLYYFMIHGKCDNLKMSKFVNVKMIFFEKNLRKSVKSVSSVFRFSTKKV